MRSLFITLCATCALGLAPAGAGASATPPYLRPVRGSIIRHYEPPPTPYAAGHRGIDMAVPVGTPVLAANDGVVAFAGPVGGELFVSIDHADGIRSTYSYLSAVRARRGATVRRGDLIGLSGIGHAGSTRPHLHFGMRVGAEYLDPEPYLLDGLRRDLSQAIRLAPVEDDSGGPAAARASIPATPAALLGAIALRAATRRRRRLDNEVTRPRLDRRPHTRSRQRSRPRIRHRIR